jgi:long-subunit acyl-CoA synthetase (AMP-forming)
MLCALRCVQAADAAGIKAYSWEQFLDLGRESPAEPVPPKPDDLCTIMYTSGTTGDPKVSPRGEKTLILSNPRPDDLCTIMYTSGDPKCQKNLLPSVPGCRP